MSDRDIRDLKIGVLQTGESPEELRPEFGDYDEMSKVLLRLSPQEADTYRVLDGIFPEDIDAYNAFVITGSRFGVYEDHAWIDPLEDFVREIHAKRKKLIGICFGHQIIAQALGGKVVKSEKGYGLGAMTYKLNSEADTDSVLALHAVHQDQIVEAPEEAEIIASSDFCPIAGLRYGDNIISFQAHPEFSREFMHALIQLRKGSVFDPDLSDEAITSLQGDLDNDQIAKLLAKFLTD